MTERELFEQQIPRIAEITICAREMSEETYAAWKTKVVEGIAEEAIEFMEKIFTLIEICLSEERQVQQHEQG